VDAGNGTMVAQRSYGRVPFKRIVLQFTVCPHGDDMDVRFETTIERYRWKLPRRFLDRNDPQRKLVLQFQMKHFPGCRSFRKCRCSLRDDRDNDNGDANFRPGCPFFERAGLFFYNDKAVADVDLIRRGRAEAKVESRPISTRGHRGGKNGFELRFSSDERSWQREGFDRLSHDPNLGSFALVASAEAGTAAEGVVRDNRLACVGETGEGPNSCV